MSCFVIKPDNLVFNGGAVPGPATGNAAIKKRRSSQRVFNDTVCFLVGVSKMAADLFGVLFSVSNKRKNRPWYVARLLIQGIKVDAVFKDSWGRSGF